MKKIFILGIEIYQKTIASLLKQALGVRETCRFYPSCSEYAKISISEKGVVRGGYLSLIRLLKCQPFYNGG